MLAMCVTGEHCVASSPPREASSANKRITHENGVDSNLWVMKFSDTDKNFHCLSTAVQGALPTETNVER